MEIDSNRLTVMLLRVYDFTAKTFWRKCKLGKNGNSEKADLVESQFRIKFKLQLK